MDVVFLSKQFFVKTVRDVRALASLRRPNGGARGRCWDGKSGSCDLDGAGRDGYLAAGEEQLGKAAARRSGVGRSLGLELAVCKRLRADLADDRDGCCDAGANGR